MAQILGNWREALRKEGESLPLEGLVLEKALLRRQSGSLVLCFTSTAFLNAAQHALLSRSLRRLLGELNLAVRVEIAYPGLKEGFLDDPAQYQPILFELLSSRMPACSPYLADASLEMAAGLLSLIVPTAMGEELLRAKKAPEALETLLRELFLLKQPVALRCREKEENLEAFLRERARMDEEAGQLAAQAIQRSESEGKKGPQILLGRAIVASATSPIGELTEQTGRVTVEGICLSEPEKKPVRGGNMLVLSFPMTDYTGSVSCKAFLDRESFTRLDRVRKGCRIKVRGSCLFDAFSKDLSLSIEDLSLLPAEGKRDDEPEKRVELHLHTQMSTMDGVSSVSALMRRAAELGHEAMAITDHGVVQAFPEAFDTLKSLRKEGKTLKLIPGMEGYLVNDGGVVVSGADDGPLARSYVVLDVETTGLSPLNDRIIELAAVKIENGAILEEFSSFVDPQMRISAAATKVNGIRDDMVEGAPKIGEVMPRLAAFCEGFCVCAHNAPFDLAFLRAAARQAGVSLPAQTLDTLPLARAVVPEIKRHRLDAVCKKLGVPLSQHHRALFDTRATAFMLMKLLERAETERGAKTLRDLNRLGAGVAASGDSYHIILLAKNQKGLENLYRLVSIGHLDHFERRPQIFRSELERHREGLILGSACEAGELIRAILDGKSDDEIEAIAGFYDFLEIQPTGNNAFMIRNGTMNEEEDLRNLNRRILRIGDGLKKPVCATCDLHFMDPQDAIFREILMHGQGFSDASLQAPLYFRNTREMLDEFAYLGERAKEVVVDNPRAIAAQIEEITMFPKHPTGAETFQPELEGAAERVREIAEGGAKALYGDQLPELIQTRLEKELHSIIGNGFATLYYSAYLLIKKSNDDGYLVGSRGSVGSSFVATVCGISEVNPLPPHYLCPSCHFSDFQVDKSLYPCGIDLPERPCPICGAPLSHNGHDTPFEVFLGFDGDKVPDIDLNFSGVYQPTAHKYVETIFGQGNVFRAGTIGTLAEKTAYGYVKKYLSETGRAVTRAEEQRLVEGCTGVKRTTGQHPGGMVIVPAEYSVYQFSPIQHPADDKESETITTHFDFGSLHDILVKLDILGHDDPTMINMLERLTGKRALEIPLNDESVMSLFRSPEALKVAQGEIGCSTGTLGIPEFGTRFVRQMLEDTKPSTMGELVRISGLSHGTNVWLNNAQDLVRDGTATLRECFCTRDDVMNYLISKGAAEKFAFTTMEAVRKGRKLTPEMESTMRGLGVPEYYIASCNKIEYLFPRSHAAAYVAMGFRVAWYKIFEPLAYYASFFTVRATEFDASVMLDSPEGLNAQIRRIEKLDRSEITARDERTLTLLEIVREMRARGLAFLPVDLYASSRDEFLIEGGQIRPPLNRLPGVGDAAAVALTRAREDGPFLSVEDLQQRSKVSSAVIDTLRAVGALRGLPETSQVSLFFD
ncbi:MAG: PolC-type DNA polymerase III [Christensenellaceae bacterium]|jgi:DNA polymerase-3 subunit alpha (Gram-positive type)|nr:PolC-type DNA polymerase III [Christensenellaceae bacterium]